MPCPQKILLFTSLLFVTVFSIAQPIKDKNIEDKYRILHWTVDDGLVYDQTYCMLKDVNGFLWIGTPQGLSRFDGSTFKNYYYNPKRKESIAGPGVWGLLEDSLHNIWVGTSKGLSRYDIRADTFTNFLPIISSNSIVPFSATKTEVYCIESGSFILSYDIYSGRKKTLIKLSNSDSVTLDPYSQQFFIYKANTNSAWLLKDGGKGLLEISLSTGKKTSYHVTTGEVMHYDAKQNSIWLNTDAGLVEFTLSDKQLHHINALKNFEKNNADHIGLDFDTQGRIWFKTHPKGIFIYDPKDESVYPLFQKDSLLQQNVSNENSVIYCDRDGIVWSGYWLRNGIYQITPISSPVKRYLADSSKNPWHNIILNCANAGNGKIWMGTDEDGIIIFDVRNSSYQTLQLQNLWSIETHPTIIPAYIDTARQKAVLKIQEDRMYLMDIPSKKSIPIYFKDSNNKTVNITKVHRSKQFNNSCIINAEYDRHNSFFLLNIDSAIAKEILSFPQNTMDEDYFTSNRYLFLKELLPPRNSTYVFGNNGWNRVVNPLDSIDWRKIVYNNDDKSYWIIAPAQLLHYDPDFHLLHEYTPENGLPYSEIFILLPDDKGNVWFNTSRYIYRLNIQTEIISQLSEKDGYVHEDFRGGGDGIKYNNGDLYFPGRGTAQGFVVITPDKYVSTPAYIYFKSINIKGFSLQRSMSVNNVQELNLKYFQNRITIETGVIDYYSNGKGKIRYKLLGRNENWQYAPSNYTIRYEELPPGKYRLLIQASNVSNEFTGPVKSLLIEITPAFWNTWWFSTLAGIFVLAGFYLIIRYRAHQKFRLQLERSEKEKQLAELQQQKTELEMQALRAQMNPHFIFNSLNSINRFILKKQSGEATEYLIKFSRLIRMILNSSANATVPLAEDIEALKLYLELERLRCEEKFSFKIKCDPDIEMDFVQVPPMLLQPFVENAIWHGLMTKESEGHVWININLENSTLLCTITDDGIGRKKAAEMKDKSGKHQSMGMKITESRIAMMQKMNGENKSVEIRDLVDADENAAGTEVVLRIPEIQ